MAVPAGGDVAVYNSAVKAIDYRLFMGLDYPALTANKTTTFGGALSAADWWYTQVGGAPLVSGGELKIRLYGAAPREQVITRPHWFPADLTKAFTITFHAAFPAADSIYASVLTVGCLNATGGQDGQPFRIVQRGSMNTDDAHKSHLFYSIDGHWQNEATAQANDLASHKYEIRYDPAAANKLYIEVDDVPVYGTAADIFGNDSSTNSGPRPYYVSFGMALPSRTPTTAQAAALLNGGAKGSPTALTVLSVQDFDVTCAVYETRTYPGYTSANAGGTTFDNVAEGERVSIDSETWASVPHGNIISIDTSQGRSRSTPSDSLTAVLALGKQSDPDGTQNVFLNARLVGRPIFLDTRVSNGAAVPTWTSWARQFVGIIERVVVEGTRLTITARDRPSSRLDSFMAIGFMAIAPSADADQDGEADGVRLDYTIDEILAEIVLVSDAIAGGALGATGYQIRLVDHAPQSLSSGGDTLKSVFDQLCERTALEAWRKYRTSGAAKYGQILVNLSVHSGSSGYTFRGKGASNVNLLAPGVKLSEDRTAGPGQLWYRNDAPAVGEYFKNIEELETLGIFPSEPYPPGDRSLNDSWAALSSLGLSTLLTLRMADDTQVTGGVAMHRWQTENMWRRVAEFVVHAHDWIEPTDLIALDDAVSTGIASSEVWVVESRRLEISDGKMRTTVTALAIDYLNSIKRTM